MRVGAMMMLLRMRVRWHPVQELLAALGIAVGVALAFAVLLANGSVGASTRQVVEAVVGRATLQIVARDSRGFDRARTLAVARATPGVNAAAPMLEQHATIHGPHGSQQLLLASIDPALVQLSGGLPAWAGGGLQLVHGVLLPQRVSTRIGAPTGKPQVVALDVRGRRAIINVAATLGSDTLGALASAPVGVLPLGQLETISGLRGRATRVLVATSPDAARVVAGELRARLGAGVEVQPADEELHLLGRAMEPSNQVTGFFAGLSVLLGLLLAFNAMLLTMPERRRTIAMLRVIAACPRGEIMRLVIFEALVLGAIASLIGLGIGLVLGVTVLHASTGYLSPAFTIGDTTVIGFGPVIVAFTGGLLVCLLASAPPLIDVFSGRPGDELLRARDAPGHALSRHATLMMLAIAVPVLVLAICLLAFMPSLAIVAAALLALATVLLVPAAFRLALTLASGPTGRSARTNMLELALATLRATTLRSLALAATGAVAVYGCVAIGGARHDLLRGIGEYARDYVGTADVWIVNEHDNQATNDLRAPPLDKLTAIPGVSAVRAYQGGFLDIRGDRVWVIARSPSDRILLPASQVLHALPHADALVRSGGWIAISSGRGARLGATQTLPTPTGPRTYRVAAVTTNLGWAPGAIIMNSTEYASAWATHAPTAIEINARPGTNPIALAGELRRLAGPAVDVVTADQRATAIMASARQGLGRLQQISDMLLGAAIIALSCAMAAAIWQRRRWLAGLRVVGCHVRQVWAILLWESLIVLGAGCLIGALVGTYGQAGADRYLQIATGFPVAQSLGGWQTAKVLALVIGAALAIVAVPSLLAARAPLMTGVPQAE